MCRKSFYSLHSWVTCSFCRLEVVSLGQVWFSCMGIQVQQQPSCMVCLCGTLQHHSWELSTTERLVQVYNHGNNFTCIYTSLPKIQRVINSVICEQFCIPCVVQVSVIAPRFCKTPPRIIDLLGMPCILLLSYFTCLPLISHCQYVHACALHCNMHIPEYYIA